MGEQSKTPLRETPSSLVDRSSAWDWFPPKMGFCSQNKFTHKSMERWLILCSLFLFLFNCISLNPLWCGFDCDWRIIDFKSAFVNLFFSHFKHLIKKNCGVKSVFQRWFWWFTVSIILNRSERHFLLHRFFLFAFPKSCLLLLQMIDSLRANCWIRPLQLICI